MENSGEVGLFTSKEIADLIADGLAACMAMQQGKRKRYIAEYSAELYCRLEIEDIATAHMSYEEAVAILLGAALAIQKLHGGK